MGKNYIKIANNLKKDVLRRGNTYRTSKYNSYSRVITYGIVLSKQFIVVTYTNIYIYVNKRRIHESSEYAFTRCTICVYLGFQQYVIMTFSNTNQNKSCIICWWLLSYNYFRMTMICEFQIWVDIMF